MGTIRRIKAVLFSLMSILAFRRANGFGMSKSIFSKCASPRVHHIPIIQTTCNHGTRSSDGTIQASRYRSEDVNKKSSWYSRLNPIKKIRQAAKWQPKYPGAKFTGSKRALLLGVASTCLTLLAWPTVALAMGGGMGAKGPVAPMRR